MDENLYIYDGPVCMFDRCLTNSWHGETVASSESKAISNLSYQFKKQNNMIASSGKITFTNKLAKFEI